MTDAFDSEEVDFDDRPAATMQPYHDLANEIEEYTADLGRDAASNCRALGWVALGGRSLTHPEEIAEKLDAIARNAEHLAEKVRELDDPREIREEEYGE